MANNNISYSSPELATALQNQVGSRRGQPVTPSRTALIQLQPGLLHSLQTLPPPSSVFTVCNNALSIYSKSLHMFMLLRLRKLSCKKIYYSLNFILVTFANYHIFFLFWVSCGGYFTFVPRKLEYVMWITRTERSPVVFCVLYYELWSLPSPLVNYSAHSHANKHPSVNTGRIDGVFCSNIRHAFVK